MLPVYHITLFKKRGEKSIMPAVYCIALLKKMGEKSIVPPVFHITLFKKRGEKSIVPQVYHIALLRNERCQVSKYMYIIQPYLTKKIYFVYVCSRLFTTCMTTHP